MYAGRNSSANPYVLASMIIVEQGANGAGNSISGRVNGYEGLYNFFNIGAFAHDGRDAVINGLIYARGKGRTTRVKSIIEGAAYYANAYINNNQNTQYLKKFNMMNGLSNVATHQYMTNIKGAADEASRLKEGYASVLNTALTFNIPVYNNMPNTVCPKPGSGNNNYYLKTLEVAGYELMPAFDIYKTEYEMIVPVDTSYASINAVPSDPGAKVTGVGNVQLTGQVTDIKVTVTSTSGEKKVYTVTVAKEANAGGSLTSSKYTIGTQITGVAFNTSVSTFKANVSVPAGYTLKLVDGKGNQLISGNVGTGTKAVLYDQNGKAVQSPVIVIKGDTNGDGKISSVDILMTQRHVISTYNLSGAYNSGADINKDGKVSSVDILMMQRHVIGTYTIKN